MARDGNGDYSRAVTPPSNGDVADADAFNTEISDIATALSDSINKNGTKAWAANQSVGGFKFTDLDAGSANGDSVRFEQLSGYVATSAIGVSVQAFDATLTALAALSWSSGSPLVQFTAADTVSLTLTPSVTDLTLSGVGKFAAGSAGSPAIQGSADPDTGFTFNGTNVMDWVSGGTARWRLNAAGSLISISGLNAIQAGSGTVGAPGQAFQADTDCGHYVIGANNIGFALGGTKYVDYATTLTQFITPVQARVPLSSETSGTLTVASANRKCLLTGNVTLNDGVFTADDFTLFDPGTSNRTFTRDTGLTMYVNGTDAASATLAANQMGAAHWRSATVVVLTGAFT